MKQHSGVRFRKTHDLLELLDLIKEKGVVIPGFLEDLDYLTPYAMEFRYDLLPWESETSLDRQQGQRLIQELWAWVEDNLGLRPL